jgi:hypothetical protein
MRQADLAAAQHLLIPLSAPTLGRNCNMTVKIDLTQAITYVTLSPQILPGSQMTLTNLTS